MRNELKVPPNESSTAEEIDDILEAAATICERAALGDLEARIVDIDDGNEQLARLFRAINDMLDIADSYVRETAAAMDNCSRGKFHRPILQRGLKGAYRKSAGLINNAAISMKKGQEQIDMLEKQRRDTAQKTQVSADTVSSSVDELKAISELIGTNSGETSELAFSVSKNSQDMVSSMTSISAACEELAVTTSEISKQTSESSRLTTNVVDEMSQVLQIIEQMKEAVDKISPVVSFIKKISSQTNLLALNATIEASRAGEAGDGFAVVAKEVKELSRTTASATSEIENHVETIGQTTQSAVEAIHGISDSVTKINANASLVNNSLGEQTNATSEIASNVSTASLGAEEINQAISGVSDAAATTNSTVANLNQTSSKLAQESKVLQAQVTKLLSD